MPIRSHVDPGLFIVFLHVPAEHVNDALRAELDRIGDGDSGDGLLNALPPRTRQVRFHENYHFWQGLRLPFLARYSFLSLRVIFLAFRELARENADYHQWDCVLPEIEQLNWKDHAGSSGAHLFWAKKPDWIARRGELPAALDAELIYSPIDLLECAASLAEFFYVSPLAATADPTALSRWAKRNPAYLAPLDFVASFLADRALAMRICVPLINAAFHTSNPTRAFIDLLGRCWGAVRGPQGPAFVAQPEPCRWGEVFQMFLDSVEFESEPDEGGELLHPPYQRLTLAQWVGAKWGSQSPGIGHPILAHPARTWSEMEAADPRLSSVLDMPHFAGQDQLDRLQLDFAPPFMVVSVCDPGGRDRVVFVGNSRFTKMEAIAGLPDISFRGFIADALTMYGAVRRASGAHFDVDIRTCGHKSCPEYAWNYCNSYPIVAADPETCGFPARIRRHITREREAHG